MCATALAVTGPHTSVEKTWCRRARPRRISPHWARTRRRCCGGSGPGRAARAPPAARRRGRGRSWRQSCRPARLRPRSRGAAAPTADVRAGRAATSVNNPLPTLDKGYPPCSSTQSGTQRVALRIRNQINPVVSKKTSPTTPIAMPSPPTGAERSRTACAGLAGS